MPSYLSLASEHLLEEFNRSQWEYSRIRSTTLSIQTFQRRQRILLKWLSHHIRAIKGGKWLTVTAYHRWKQPWRHQNMAVKHYHSITRICIVQDTILKWQTLEGKEEVAFSSDEMSWKKEPSHFKDAILEISSDKVRRILLRYVTWRARNEKPKSTLFPVTSAKAYS